MGKMMTIIKSDEEIGIVKPKKPGTVVLITGGSARSSAKTIKELDHEFCGFSKITSEMNETFIAWTFSEKKDETAICLMIIPNGDRLEAHIIQGYNDENGEFVSEGKLDSVEFLDMTGIVKNSSKKQKKLLQAEVKSAW